MNAGADPESTPKPPDRGADRTGPAISVNTRAGMRGPLHVKEKAMAEFLPETTEDDEFDFTPEEDLLVEEISIDGMCGVY
ncbi:hypothetical protein KCMC57_up16520 [Kitasatospora sp. CMC57]|uniref:Mycofactocin n=1 Tax=Kitasatospora sp. CMC57 TaxID=3231513 RepID=A0AB33JVG1_9ACTN